MGNEYLNNYYSTTRRGNYQTQFDGQTRCKRCNRPLSDPTQAYGPYCAQLLGIGQKNAIDDTPTETALSYTDMKDVLKLDSQTYLSYTGYVNKIMAEDSTTVAYNEPARVKTVNPPAYSIEELRTEPEKLNDYIYRVSKGRGINENTQINAYQILYGAWENPPMYRDDVLGKYVYKPTGPNNRYSNYNFDTMDALNWLIQTGGDVNFVLQMRDIHHLRDSKGDLDEWAIKDRVADWQAYIINTFLDAADILLGFGKNVKIPRFFIGGAEENPQTLIDDNGRDGIYKQVLSKLGENKGVVAGAYFGEDISWKDINPPEESNWQDEKSTKKNPLVLANSISEKIHESYGGQMLFIPFYDLQNDGNVENYFNRSKKLSEYNHSCSWGNRPIFDTIIFQPGTFFYEKGKGLNTDDIYTLANKVNAWNANKNATTMGMELEYDMGVVTGRDDDTYSLRDIEKRHELKEYINAVKKLYIGTPIGIYSGGPNEQAYSTPVLNSNKHNTGNHIVQDSNRNYYVKNNTPYNEFPYSYSGNFVYDMSDYVYRDMLQNNSMNQKLFMFLNQR